MRVDYTAIIGSLAAFVIGVIALWSNPKRSVNWLFFTASIHVAVWLISLRMVFDVGDEHAVFWIRTTTAIGGALSAHAWLVKEAIAERLNLHDRKWRLRLLGWVAVSSALVAICYTEAFIPSSSTVASRLRGWGFHAHTIGALLLWGFIAYECYKDTRRSTGVKRMELQVWLIAVCGTAMSIILLMGLNVVARGSRYTSFQPLLILGLYAGTALAITTHRIFDARQVILVSLEKSILILVVSGLFWGLSDVLRLLLPEAVSLLATMAVVLWFASIFGSWLDQRLSLFPQAVQARKAAFVAARRESRPERLESAFLGVLKGWGQTESALILVGEDGVLRGGSVEIRADSVVLQTLRRLRWATPERLAREKADADRKLLNAFLTEHLLGLAVIDDSSPLNVVVGVGVPVSRRPYTYPQVTQLMELVSIFEGAFERANLVAKAQHSEQLATVGLLGASLAHEIRNPLVSIKTIVQLLPSRHQDPVFRDKFFRLMSDEVNRIDRLTEQLLELASPKAYVAEMIDLHSILRATLELVAPKAADKRVKVLTELQASPDRVCSDSSAIKQVVLNLCLNAIQALESQGGERWIKVSTHKGPGVVEMVISDNGPGINPAMHVRLFQPFQSSKSSGFGLGLAICRDIMTSLDASISVDPPTAGQGATFRVVIPCQPSSS
jgi:signal transduction histidine kinase